MGRYRRVRVGSVGGRSQKAAGGEYELFWNAAEAEFDSTIGCRVTAFVPNKLLAFEWRGLKQYSAFMNECDPLTHVTVAFVPCGDASQPCTEVHLVHTGWRSTPAREEVRRWLEVQWDVAFKELVKQLRRRLGGCNGALKIPDNG